MTFAIVRLTEGDPVEADRSAPGQSTNWKPCGTFSHYDRNGAAVVTLEGGHTERITELARLRKRAL